MGGGGGKRGGGRTGTPAGGGGGNRIGGGRKGVEALGSGEASAEAFSSDIAGAEGLGSGAGGGDAFGSGAAGGAEGLGATLFGCWPTIVASAGLSPGAGVLLPEMDGEVADGAKEDASSSWYNGNRSVTLCRCFRNDVMLFLMSIKTINLSKVNKK